MSDPIILVFLAVGGVCFGFLLGFILRGFTHRKADSDEKAETEQAQAEAPSQKKSQNRNWVEVANLWRDGRDGQLIFQIEDQYYKRNSELTPKEREILLKVVMDFYRWLEPPSAVASGSENPNQAAHPIDSGPVTTYAAGKNGARSVSLNPVNMLSHALETDVSVSGKSNGSMVAQVDAILQEKLQDANMQKWAVRLTEFPSKGMIVMVGLEQYEGIDEVPYERVRTIIRASVKEWERRAEKGELVQI